MRRRGIPLLLALAALAAAPGTVLADAELVASEPAGGSTVTELATVILTFSEPLNGDKSSVVVRLAGQTVAEGAVDPGEATRLVAGLPDAVPGEYEVRYTANSRDGHLVRDRFTFTYAPVAPASQAPTTTMPAASPAASAVAPASPGATTPATVAPSASAEPGPAPASAGDAIVPVVVALALVALAGMWLLRRRAG